MSYAAVKKYRQKNPEKVREWNRRYYRKHRESLRPYNPRVSTWNPHHYVSDEEFENNNVSLQYWYNWSRGLYTPDEAKKLQYYLFSVDKKIQADIEAYDDWDKQAQGKFINDKAKYKGIA